MTALFEYLSKNRVDCKLLWSKIHDIIIKSFISIEDIVNQNIKILSCHRSNCFELFGFDILIDSKLRPWLMEINLSPSLNCDSPLDFNIKSHLITDMFTLIGLQTFDRRRIGFHGYPMNSLSARSINIKNNEYVHTELLFKLKVIIRLF